MLSNPCHRAPVRFLLVFVGAVLATSLILAQDEPPDPSPVDVGLVERSGITLTLLDVNVLDRQGRPMPDLKKEDFTVILNGRVRPIYSLDNLCVGTTEDQELIAADGNSAPDATRQAPQPASPLTSAIRQADRPTHIVLYMDFSQVKMSGRATLLDAVENWVLETMRPDERAQLVGYTSKGGLRVLVDFTESREELLAAIADARNDTTLYDSFADQSEWKILCCGGPSEAIQCPYPEPPPPRPCKAWAWEGYKHSAAGMRALRTHLIGLETLPGRKALLYFQQDGSIFPSRRYRVNESRAGDLVSELDEVGAEANLSRTTIYAIQSSGPRLADATNLGANLADFTGGTYNRGDMDLEAFMQSVGREPRCVYRIGIARPPKAGGILRAKILVHNRPVEGRYRVRFLDAMDRWWRRAQAILLAPERATDVRIATDIVPVAATHKRWRVKARVAVDIESVSALPMQGKQRGNWEVGALLAEARGKDTSEMLAVSQVHTDSEIRGPLCVVHERTIEDLPPGDYRIGAFVRDRNLNVFGGAEASLPLPDPRKRGVAGPILMLSDRPHLRAALPLLREKKPMSPGRARSATGTVPLSRSVRIGEAVAAVTFICTTGDGPPDPQRLLRYVTRDRDALFRFEEAQPDKAGSCYSLVDRIETGPLGRGDYAYHLSWSGAGEEDRIEIEAPFRIEDSGAMPAVKAQPGRHGPAVQALLERLAQSADTYREHALKFSCEETIKWSGRGTKNSLARTTGRERFGYVFTYDDDEGFTDYRTRLKRRTSKRTPRRVTPEEFNVPRYLGSAYLWIFTFKRDRWPHHEYELMGEETVLDRRATKLGFKPVLPVGEGLNDWYGTAWIDVETAQLLKVEAYTPDDQGRLEEMERHAAGEAVNEWNYDIERITTWFEIEVNSLRFPSRVEIRRINYGMKPGQDGWRIRSDPVLQVDQSYQRYEFFGVSTREELASVAGVEP